MVQPPKFCVVRCKRPRSVVLTWATNWCFANRTGVAHVGDPNLERDTGNEFGESKNGEECSRRHGVVVKRHVEEPWEVLLVLNEGLRPRIRRILAYIEDAVVEFVSQYSTRNVVKIDRPHRGTLCRIR